MLEDECTSQECCGLLAAGLELRLLNLQPQEDLQFRQALDWGS